MGVIVQYNTTTHNARAYRFIGEKEPTPPLFFGGFFFLTKGVWGGGGGGVVKSGM